MGQDEVAGAGGGEEAEAEDASLEEALAAVEQLLAGDEPQLQSADEGYLHKLESALLSRADALEKGVRDEFEKFLEIF